VVVVRRATGRNQGDVSADYGISGVISGSAAPAALRHPSDLELLKPAWISGSERGHSIGSMVLINASVS
jgi:hypothetical protein